MYIHINTIIIPIIIIIIIIIIVTIIGSGVWPAGRPLSVSLPFPLSPSLSLSLCARAHPRPPSALKKFVMPSVVRKEPQPEFCRMTWPPQAARIHFAANKVTDNYYKWITNYTYMAV